MRKIIIPAAGKAVRFNGILKEFAPIDTTTPLHRMIWLAKTKLQASYITLVTNAAKYEIHKEFIDTIAVVYPEIQFTLINQSNYGNRDLLDAIITGLQTQPWNIAGGLLLPDTITDFDTIESTAPLTFGTFPTTEPERFSVLYQKSIYTKSTALQPGIYNAWGVVLWDANVAQKMLTYHNRYTHYDDMFYHMMMMFGYTTFTLDYYYDIGSIKTYLNYLEDHNA